MPRSDRDVLLGQPGPDPGPCELEPKLAVLEIDPGSPVSGRRRLPVDVATPPPMRVAGRLHDPADRQTAPNHLVVVFLPVAVNDGRTQRDGFQIVGHQLTCLQWVPCACSAEVDPLLPSHQVCADCVNLSALEYAQVIKAGLFLAASRMRPRRIRQAGLPVAD